jgi:hypothetical protein
MISWEISHLAFCYKFDNFCKFFRLRQILALCKEIPRFLGSMIVGSGVLILQYEHYEGPCVTFELLVVLLGEFLFRFFGNCFFRF